MPSSLTLHVGLPRSGVRHLQEVLAHGRRVLAAHGWLYPGRGYLPRGGLNQQAVGYAVAGESFGGLGRQARAHAARHFGIVCAEIAAHPGHVLVSADSLAHLDAPGAHRLLEMLGVRPEAVRVVVTARDLGGLLPALWQGCVEDGSTDPYESYLAALLDRRRDDGAAWRTALDLPALVSRWSGVVGLDRVALVTVPQHGAETGLLWARFADATGMPDRPPSPLPAVPPGHDGDAPFAAAQVQLLRTVNAVMRDGGIPVAEQHLLRGRLVEAWRAHPRSGPRLTVPAPARQAVRAWAAEDVARLRALDVRVTGPLADLEPLFGPLPGPSVHPAGEHSAREVLAAVTRARAGAPGVVERVARALGSLARTRGGRRPPRRVPVVPALPRVPPAHPAPHTPAGALRRLPAPRQVTRDRA